ncbi:MAG: amidohydrolase family protein [Planctomycetes bacterium]|nr:amidohydrolase family protein [Planctomycetota bacterium]
MKLRASFPIVLCLASSTGFAQEPGERGGPGLAITAAKALICSWDGAQVLDRAVLLVDDGRITALGVQGELAIPSDYAVRDFGAQWLMPGMLELHCHVGGSIQDINDVVYLTQPELRVAPTVINANPLLMDALSAGVTTVLYIPGSGVNCGGRGVLFKTGLGRYEEALVREPGSLKIAQYGNPESWAVGVAKTFENWSLRNMLQQGRAYHARWKAFEEGRGERPERDLRLDVFRDLFDHKTQVSTHTQIYQVVLMTLTMIRQEFGLDVYIDHGEWDGALAAPLAEKLGVPAIVGPRVIDWNNPGYRFALGFDVHNDGRYEGIHAKYQAGGHSMIGFNTDCVSFRGLTPPPEELPLQAAIAVRYGFDDSAMQTVRGLTIVPAKAAGLEQRLGSLEVGKDADIVVVTGHPIDPRTSVEAVFIEGRKVYDAVDGRRF